MRLHIATSNSVGAWFADWKRLWREVAGNPFLHPGWHMAFAEAQGSGLSPVIIGVREGDALRGLLPMRRDADGVLRFLTSPRSDYEDALADAKCVHEVMRCIAEYLAAERFELGEVPEGSSLAGALRARGVSSTPSAKCPGIVLSPETVKEIAGRKRLRRDEKLLARHGAVRLVDVPANRLEQALSAFMDQHVSRWLAVGDHSMFLDERNRDFYHRLLMRDDFREFGRLQILMAGDRDSAYHLALLGRSTFVMYKPTFDLNLEAESPGKILLKRLIEYAGEQGNSYFDFSRGDEDYKRRFATEVRQNQRFSRGVPITPRITAAVGRRVRRAYAVTGGWLAGRMKRQLRSASGSLCQLVVPDSCPDAPPGFRVQFGIVDLVSFGALQRRIPEYVTTARMRSAIERQHRGDRLLVTTRVVDGMPVHLAWLRTDNAVPDPSVAASGPGHEARPTAVFDSWTAPDCRDSGIPEWSFRRLAWEAAQSGRIAEVWCAAGDKTTRRQLITAGVRAERRGTPMPGND